MKIVALGDSLTFGYGVYPNEGYIYLLSKLIDYNIINSGINGDTTTSMLLRAEKDLIKPSPNYLLLMGGTNDLLSRRPVKQILDNLEMIIIDSISKNVIPIICAPPTLIPELANKLFVETDTYHYAEENLFILRNELELLAKKYSLTYIDFYTLSKNHINQGIYLDGIHLNFLGNTLMAQFAHSIFRRDIL